MRISIQVTVPKELLSQKQVQDSIAYTMAHKSALEVKSMFRATTKGWKNKPTFKQKLVRRAWSISETIYPDGANYDQYAIVNYGSPPHIIHIKNAQVLSWQPGYSPSTRPRVISSRANKRSGPFFHRQLVQHPGFEAREFDATIAKIYAPTFKQDIEDAVNAVAVRQSTASKVLKFFSS